MQITLKLDAVSVGAKIRRIPKSTNGSTMHWATRAQWNQAWHTTVGQQVQLHRKSFGKLPLPFTKLILIFYSIQEIDKDNMFQAGKPLIDILKINMGNRRFGKKVIPKPGLGVITDDRSAFLDWDVRWKKAEHRIDEHVEMNFKF